MRVTPAKESCLYVPGRAEQRGSHRQMSRSMKLPSLPARAGPRNPGQSGSQLVLWWGVDLKRWDRNKIGNLAKVITGFQSPSAKTSLVVFQPLVWKSL